MIEGLFKLKIKKDIINHFIIGYQHIIIIELFDKNELFISSRIVEKLLFKNIDIYFFNSYIEMEENLDILIENTNDNYIIIIN